MFQPATSNILIKYITKTGLLCKRLRVPKKEAITFLFFVSKDQQRKNLW